MVSQTTDRFGNTGSATVFVPAGESVAIKAPCDVATTANITLSGEQTLDGVTTDGSRVLVKNQTDQTENGVYYSAVGAWVRARDFDSSRDIVKGTRVLVTGGSTQFGEYRISTADPIVLGTSSIAFETVTFGAASEISNDSGVSGASVSAALDTLDSGKQAASSELTAVAALASTGIAVRTGSGTWTVRTITGPAAGISVTNGSGVSGAPTLALANDLSALEGLASTGLAARTATDTWAQRTITGVSNRTTVTNGDGVSGNPTIDISSSYVGQATITTLGTVGTGIWQGTAVAVAYGGTGAANAASARTNLGLAIGSDVQAYDAELAALAGLTSAADKLPYFTGSGTAAVADFTAAGRALVDDANAAAQRTTLGLAIGTDVQAYDATLTSIAALGTAADKIAYTTGIDTWAEAALTAAARSILDDASVGAIATTLGLGTSDSPQFTAINLGHASDTTLTRVSAGVVAIEGDTILTAATGQPLDADLTTIAGLTATTDYFMQSKASAWTARSPTQVTADLDVMVGDSGAGGTKGLVPAPAAGDSTKFLRGDATWQTIPGGGDALTSGNLSQFAATTSAQLAGVISDETGSGALVFATSPTLVTPALGTPASGNLANCTFPTLNQNTTGSAATLTTPRAIYGNNFDGSAALTGIIASTYGGTGNGFTKFTGPTTAEKTFTLPDSSATLLYSGGALGTPASGTLTNCSGLPVSGIAASTSTALGVGSIELGHASDTTISRNAAGVIAVEGSIVLMAGKNSMWVPANAMTPRTTNGAASGTAEMTTNKNMVNSLDFDGTTQEFAQFSMRMPKSWNEGTITFIAVASQTGAATNFGVVFGLDAVALSSGESLDVAFGTAQTVSLTLSSGNTLYMSSESSAITIGATPSEGDVVMFRVHRDPADASDTMTSDARLHGVLVLYTTNAANDA